MDKPHGLIWREPVDYEMGRLHVGRVSIGIGVLLIAYNIVAAILLIGGMLGYYATDDTAPDVSAVFSFVCNAGVVLFAFEIAVGILVAIILGIRWVIKDIRVDGPGGR